MAVPKYSKQQESFLFLGQVGNHLWCRAELLIDTDDYIAGCQSGCRRFATINQGRHQRSLHLAVSIGIGSELVERDTLQQSLV